MNDVKRANAGDDEGRADRRDLMGKTEMRGADLRRDLRLAVHLLELWRLCGKSSCRRARACRGDARRCCDMLLGWSAALELKDKRVGFQDAMRLLRGPST
jgi:hypothetical protein